MRFSAFGMTLKSVNIRSNDVANLAAFGLTGIIEDFPQRGSLAQCDIYLVLLRKIDEASLDEILSCGQIGGIAVEHAVLDQLQVNQILKLVLIADAGPQAMCCVCGLDIVGGARVSSIGTATRFAR